MTWEQILKRGYGKKFMHPVARKALSTVKIPSDIGTIQTIIREYLIEENKRRENTKGSNPPVKITRAMVPNPRLMVFIKKEIREGNMRQQGDKYLWVGKDI
tara:strand:+ start:619 stop:921 length:303 start_codon:yes stop_codon:yes gene_type:complete